MEKGKIEFECLTLGQDDCPCNGTILHYHGCTRVEDERRGQIQNFEHLLETLNTGDIETGKAWIKMAIRKLKGQPHNSASNGSKQARGANDGLEERL